MNKTWDRGIKDEVYKRDTYKLKKVEFGRSPLHIVDIGANYGWFSILAAELYPECNIYAYELMKDNHLAAQDNFKKFDLRNAQVFHMGVTGNDPIAKILETTMNLGGSKAIYDGSASYNSIKRYKSTQKHNIIHDKGIPQQISVKEIFEVNKIDYIDFLKIDCEGCEFQIFNQIFEHDLDKRIKHLAMEVHGKGHPEWDNLKKELEKRFSTCKWGKITIANNK
jgi:FkbM family methyltransferase